jgi:hypothetical protein
VSKSDVSNIRLFAGLQLTIPGSSEKPLEVGGQAIASRCSCLVFASWHYLYGGKAFRSMLSCHCMFGGTGTSLI